MRIDLRYGEGSLPLEDDRDSSFYTILPTQVPSISNLSSEILRALSVPRYIGPLSSHMHPGSTVAVALEGPLLPQHTKLMLNLTLSTVLSHGVQPEDVTIISDLEEDRRIALNGVLSDLVSKGHQLTVHDPNDVSKLELVGNTPTYSVPVYAATDFVRADFRIGIGTIRPTPFGGATGGRMAVLPGMVGEKTRYQDTKLMATMDIGLLDIDIPCSKDMAEAADLAGLDFIVNSVVDHRENVVEIVAGDFMMAWADGVDLVRRLALAKISRRADIAIVSAGGATDDSTLYKSVDALSPALEATRLGGCIMLVAECSAGAGSDGLLKGVSESTTEQELILAAQTDFELGMERARLLLRATATRKIVICSRLKPSLVEERLRCIPVRDPQEGLEVARGLVGSKAHISIIHNGGHILPRMGNS